MVTPTTAVTLPGAAVRDKGRECAGVTAEPAYVPLASGAPTRAYIELDAVLVGAIREPPLRGLIGVLKAKPAGIP